MDFNLISLPYEVTALEPTIGHETVNYHFGKHTKTYIDNLNNLKKDTEFADMTLEEIVKNSKGAIFNNAAQAWNHFFYFEALSPAGKRTPSGTLYMQIQKDFGSFEDFCTQFEKAGATLFGSGWVWLVKDPSGKLSIETTQNAGTPLTTANVPLLCVDVWEHAYYLDYQNRRAEYLNKMWNVIDWAFVEARFEK